MGRKGRDGGTWETKIKGGSENAEKQNRKDRSKWRSGRAWEGGGWERKGQSKHGERRARSRPSPGDPTENVPASASQIFLRESGEMNDDEGPCILPQTDTGCVCSNARAFSIAELNSCERTLLLNADIAMGYSGVCRELLLALAEEYKNTTYHAGNVALLGTHQHSGACGYLENLLPQATSKGLHPQSPAAIVDTALHAVRRAHYYLLPGTLSIGAARVEGGPRKMSATAYLANPVDEREVRRERRGWWDNDFFAVFMRCLKYQSGDSGGNKGMRHISCKPALVEPPAMSGNTTYVASFVHGAVDDTLSSCPIPSHSSVVVYPSFGAFCKSPGKPYDGFLSVANPATCGGRGQERHGRGPAFTEDAYGFASRAESGASQARMAGAIVRVDGEGMTTVRSVRSVHAYADMSRYEFALRNGTRQINDREPTQS
ncbi:Neutral/alkaline non-lysosomal ceramidase-domain-containing protein [Mycena galopus ATCC 62051]|nr:Neutral/alkaline non-lysosomal ceramidase-domain-containing protein [Mycena galopus ATCC 62051]KAF8147468.1 Neutral/alkaline non-lysosomal ceramidase-domain-containing protein [Mycena galopus ATCC 62051]